jgi:hypothetical protein
MTKPVLKRQIYFVCIVLTLGLFGCDQQPIPNKEICLHLETSEATCTSPSVCLSCGEVVSGLLEHKYDMTVEAFPTCTNTGVFVYKCVICGDTYEDIISTIDHSGNETITVAPTLTDEGEVSIDCNMCGETITKRISALGTYYDSAYPITASKLYKSIKNDDYSQYLDKYLLISGTVKSITQYPDMIGYYLYGTTGEGVVCWVDGSELIANTDSYVEFSGLLSPALVGIDHVEFENCRLANEVEVTDEPGMTRSDPISISVNDISSRYVGKWIEFDGIIESRTEWGDDYWYSVNNVVACLSADNHSVGESVTFVGKLLAAEGHWATVDCIAK